MTYGHHGDSSDIETEEERAAWQRAFILAHLLKRELQKLNPSWHHWREVGGHLVSEQ